jgi:phthiocerol/phenolphthiocerol synthesis type-I polyketide synthase C
MNDQGGGHLLASPGTIPAWPDPSALKPGTLAGHFRAMFGQQPDARLYHFVEDGEGEPLSMTNAELDRRAMGIAAELRERVPAGGRALIICPPGLDYVASFFACLYAGVIAVPVYPPNPALLKRTLPRLLGVIQDAQPAVVLAPAFIASLAPQFTEFAAALSRLSWLAVDSIDSTAADRWQPPATSGHDPAFLQYTSGSTGQPKGVMVTHASLLHNLGSIDQLFVGNDDSPIHSVTWLPPYHDMGLIGGLLMSAYGGYPVTFMSPLAFLKRPVRWLRAITDYRATHSGAPNFAYELCVSKISGEERAGLDLSSWKLAFSGAEPVRPETLDRFSRAFEPCGFRRKAFYPCYGLAEATLLVSGGSRLSVPATRRVQAKALQENRVVHASGSSARTVIGCGKSAPGQKIAIVDPAGLTRVPPGRVGEIWVSGPSVAGGYWGQPEESAEIFAAHLADTGEGPFLRTGDLGFLSRGELFVTGRRKDLIIVAGKNHYPQDIEQSIEECHPALRLGGGVACSVDEGNEERLLIVHEVNGDPEKIDADRVIWSIRDKVAREHDLRVSHVVLVRRGSVPKTSSGKVQRSACRAAFLEGGLGPAVSWSMPSADAPARDDRPATQAADEDVRPASAPAARSVDAAGVPADGPELQQWLSQEIASRLNLVPEAIDPGQPMAAYGLRSIDMVGLVGDLELKIGRSLPATLPWEYPTIEALAFAAARLGSGETPSAPGQQASPSLPRRAGEANLVSVNGRPPAEAEPVAIIGIGCRFPGGADSPESFWQLLAGGRDAVTEVPADRWKAEDFFDQDISVPGKANTRWGGFVEGTDMFDPHFFGISPREAARMDPQQRLLAEVAWEALEDAGVVPEDLPGSRTGVFIGIATNDYGHLQFQDLNRIDAYTGTGNAFSIAANRLSYLFDLRGPSISTDTACSSSLVTVHQACVSLSLGECTMALAGGVNLIFSPALAINFSKAGAMAPDGRCKAFDARADGYVRSEGAGIVVLKPLRQAVADRDSIYAVILGGAVNQDGRTNGLMAPNPHAQEAVLRAAYASAGVAPGDVDYIEAHGTGTLLGDPIEAKAMSAVVGDGRDPSRPCLIGSVKSNLGHLEAAAGVAGLVKTALMVRHRQVPPSLHYQVPNPHIPFQDLPLEVASSIRAWPSSGSPALAGVSSFGFGGTNAHLVLREPPPSAPGGQPAGPRAQVLTISARSDEALRQLAARYQERLDAPPADLSADLPADLAADLCAAAAVRRTHYEHRLACVGSSAAELQDALESFRRVEPASGLSWGTRRVGRHPKVTFVFAGQGPRWWPLAADLASAEPEFRAVLGRCDVILRRLAGWSLLAELAADHDRSRLSDTAVGQPALCAVQVALAALWRSWGIEPAAVVGHSAGEIAAAHVAGALSLDDALRVALHRGRVIRAAVGKGKMAVAGISAGQAREFLADAGAAWVAASNGPNSTVLSGEPAALARVATAISADGNFCRVLETVDYASHSPQMEPLQGELTRSLVDLVPRAVSIPFISTVRGKFLDGAELDAAYWGANLREPVVFDRAIRVLADSGHDAFVEISPHPMLGDAITECLASQDAPGAVVTSLRRDTPGRESLLGQLGELYCAGFPVDWRAIYGPRPPMITLPSYQWQRQRYWLDDEDGHRRPVGRDGHPVLETFVRSAAEPEAYHWCGRVDLEGFPWLRDHQVDGTAVLPASLLLDAVASASARVLGDGPAIIEDVQFTSVTVVPATAGQATLQIVAFPETAGAGSFRVFTRSGEQPGDDDWAEVARGRFRSSTSPGPRSTLAEARDRCPQPADHEALYARLAQSGLQYGPAFQGIESVWCGEHEAVARLRRPAELTADNGSYLIHPALLDSCLQVLAAALQPVGPTPAAMYLPVSVGRFTLSAPSGSAPSGSAPSGNGTARWAHAVLDPGGQEENQISGAAVVLFDEAGHRVGEVSGITLRRLDPAGARDPVADSLLQVGWREADHGTTSSPASVNAATGWWLLFADQGGVCDNLRTLLLARGAECVTVGVGPQYRRLHPTRYEIDAGRPEDVAALLADVRGARSAPCAGVVYAWSLDGSLPPDADPGQLRTAQELGCIPVLHLIKALGGEEGAGQAPRLVLATRGAQQVGDDRDIPALAQSSLWGLARVIMLEHAELHPTIIDLDPRQGGDDAAGLLVEILSPGRDQIALRGGKRYTPYLQAWNPQAVDLPVLQDRRPFDTQRDGNLRILATQPGILNSLAPTLCERTPPSAGEVQIEVVAAGLNFSDVLKALGICPGVPPGIVPLGAECAGRVTAVGADVDAFKPGDAVMAIAPSALAAFVTTPSYLVAPRPQALTDEQAAAIPIAFLTAVYGLEYLARLGPGEKVLIHSATGGVGLAALQVARRNGAEVFATAGTKAKRDMLRTLGVKHVMDSRSLRFADQIMELTGGRGVDVVLNSLAGEALTRSLSLLAPGGRFVEIGKQDIYRNNHLGLGALRYNRSFFAVDLERSFAEEPVLIRQLFDMLARGLAAGDLTALPVTSYSYAEADTAFSQMAQARHTGKIVLRPSGNETVAAGPQAPAISSEGTYLITGGLGALGLETARYLTGKGARHLVLVGRRPPSAAAQQVVQQLRAAQAEISVRAVDVSRFDDVAALMAEISTSMPPLTGIVHTAGILDDGFLLQLDEERFRSVAAPKADAAWHLHRASRDIPLDFFVLYSSAAALLGSPGQGNYAAANAFLDALAVYRHSLGLPALSIGWGPWSQIGLVADPSRAGSLPAYGIESLRPEDGIAALDRLLFTPSAQATVLALDRARLRDAADSGMLPDLLAGLLAPSAGAAVTGRQGSTEIRQKLLAVQPGRRRSAILQQHCMSEAARVLKTDVSKIDATAPMASMGFDSLMSLELRKRLEISLGVELAATVAWRFPTIEKLVPFLADRMEVPLEPGSAGSGPTAASGPAAASGPPADLAEPTGAATGTADHAEPAGRAEAARRPEADLAQLSDSDLEALLLAKMTRIDEGR